MPELVRKGMGPHRPLAGARARRPRLAPLTLPPILLAALALALMHGADDPHPGAFIRVESADTLAGELVVQFGDIPREQRDAIVASFGAVVERELSVEGYVQLSVPVGQEEAIGEALVRDPAVLAAEEVAYRRLMFVPNDELYEEQWNLDMIQMEPAWDLSTGAIGGPGGAGGGSDGVIVAVLDSGVAYEDYVDSQSGRVYQKAPDLAATKFIAPYDAYDQDPHANDDNGHGTHVAGTIAQATNNGIGVAGIAYNARIMPVKVCGDSDGNLATSHDYLCPDIAIAEGIIYAVNNGARIINMSLGGDIPLGEGSLHRQALDYARAANVVVVAAAGNGTGSPRVGRAFLAYPAAIPSVISVGAVNASGLKASYSDYGLGESGNRMDLVAPGGDGFNGGKYVRQNTYAHICSGAGVPANFTLFGYCPLIGTSQSAAHVSGVAALIRAKYPALSATQVRTLLNCSAMDVGPPGPDLQHGNGVVQAFWALVDSDLDGTPNCLDATAGVVCSVPVATPAPSATPVLSATPTQTPLPLGVPAGVPTDSPPPPTDTPPPPTDTPPPPTDTPPPPTDTPAPGTDTPVPSESPAVTDTPTPGVTDTPAAGTDTPPPTAEPTPTSTPQPTASPTVEASPSPTPLEPRCGDVDCDLDLDAVDALFILRFVAALQPYAKCIDAGDVDCGGQIDAVDALGVLRTLVTFSVNRLPGCPPLGYS